MIGHGQKELVPFVKHGQISRLLVGHMALGAAIAVDENGIIIGMGLGMTTEALLRK